MEEYRRIQRISSSLNFPEKSVIAVLNLFSEGSSVPFIARYRKEMTGNLDEVAIEAIKRYDEKLKALDERRNYILETIGKQGKLTESLRDEIKTCLDEHKLEELYLPFKRSRKTRASVACARGLEPLAKMIMTQRIENVEIPARRFISADVSDVNSAVAGACDIIAEWISENSRNRNIVRRTMLTTAIIRSAVVKGKEADGDGYRMYFDYKEPLHRCSSHRYLAIRRGEREGILKVSIVADDSSAIRKITDNTIRKEASKSVATLIGAIVEDSYKRLIRPSVENEVCAAAKERSDKDAIEIFAQGLRQILMSPPLTGRKILGVDPGYRTGCKIVCLDKQGNLLEHSVIYPCAPRYDIDGASSEVMRLYDKYGFDTVAVGNGTASRETFDFFKSLYIAKDIDVRSVSEQGASIYSASEVARREFPHEDVTVRGAVSIGRRLLDPLAELVKIPPQSIGVGQYQHDVNAAELSRSLDFVVECCVNQVGVDVNTASVELLSHVSGISSSMAANIVRFRKENGPFASREDLMHVPRMGAKTFQQCAGFLCIPGATNPLDRTRIHPECYGIVEDIASDSSLPVNDIIGNDAVINGIDMQRYLTPQVGIPTIEDILKELKMPWRDPRIIPSAIEFNDSIRSISDLEPGMELNGRVSNITAFGAFVDIGIKESGLIHISQISQRFIRSVSEILKIGQIVNVRVLEVDALRHRVSLTMKNL